MMMMLMMMMLDMLMELRMEMMMLMRRMMMSVDCKRRPMSHFKGRLQSAPD